MRGEPLYRTLAGCVRAHCPGSGDWGRRGGVTNEGALPAGRLFCGVTTSPKPRFCLVSSAFEDLNFQTPSIAEGRAAALAVSAGGGGGHRKSFTRGLEEARQTVS